MRYLKRMGSFFLCAAMFAVLLSFALPHHHDAADHDESCAACRFQHDYGVTLVGSAICHRSDTTEETRVVALATIVFQKIVSQAAQPRGPPALI